MTSIKEEAITENEIKVLVVKVAEVAKVSYRFSNMLLWKIVSQNYRISIFNIKWYNEPE